MEVARQYLQRCNLYSIYIVCLLSFYISDYIGINMSFFQVYRHLFSIGPVNCAPVTDYLFPLTLVSKGEIHTNFSLPPVQEVSCLSPTLDPLG